MREFIKVYDRRERLIAIDYLNGDSIEYRYDDAGNLKGVVDTSCGVSIHMQSVGWFKVLTDGSTSLIDGSLSVDQQSGALILTLHDGSRVITNPDGSVHRSQQNNIA